MKIEARETGRVAIMGFETELAILCDTCGEPIESLDEGVVVAYGQQDDPVTTDVAVVHKGQCDNVQANQREHRGRWFAIPELLVMLAKVGPRREPNHIAKD